MRQSIAKYLQPHNLLHKFHRYNIGQEENFQSSKEEKKMQKTICKVVYDTEAAELIHKYTFGNYGDPAGYEEILFQMPGGQYFVYGNGGAESPYAEEKISRLAKAKVEAWIEEHK